MRWTCASTRLSTNEIDYSSASSEVSHVVTAIISWLLCFILLAGPTLGLEALAELPRSACMLLIWITLAGVPRAARSTDSEGYPVPMAGLLTRVGLSLALMGPLLCVAGALDHAAGFPPSALCFTLASGTLLALGMQVAAQRSSLSSRGALRYGWGWLTCVLLAPTLQAVAGWDGSPGGTREGWADFAALSPLEWVHGRAMALDFQWPILPAALAVGLLLLATPPMHPTKEKEGDEDATEAGGEQPGEGEVSA